jgi:hypothetical protein
LYWKNDNIEEVRRDSKRTGKRERESKKKKIKERG